jgi:NAD(P)-dependent dehydrogenase (short-subunit alcohol dehydrogenase family)
MRLKGKVALLTGAAAAIEGELMGFGGAAAHLFVREGAKVVLTDIRDDLGERAAAVLRADGHDARYMHLDVTSEGNWASVVDAVMGTHGRLDILFNNAGVGFPRKVEDITVAIWEHELGVRAKGVFLGTRSAIPAMRKGGGGSIINTSSVMGIVGSPTSPAYSAAKGAITIFTNSAALQYAKENYQLGTPRLCRYTVD